MSRLLNSTPVPLIEVENLFVRFGADGPYVVKGISFTLNKGESLALVGESGSGKSVTSRTLAGLAGHNAHVEATRLRFEGEDLNDFNERKWRQVRGARIGFVMQDALGSLDPLRLVGQEIAEPLRLHTNLSRKERDARVIELLRAVEVPEPEVRARQHPFQLSGGLRQRALIASSIACGPRLLIADEPTTALDAAVQAQVLDLLDSLRTQDTSLLIVSHDFAVVSRLADRVAVMQHGVIVEQGPVEAVLQDPKHPYTKSLLAAVAAVHVRGASLAPAPAKAPRIEVSGIEGANTNVSNATAPETPVLEARELTKSFIGPDSKKRTVVSSVSFGLRRGETIGIVGESGSGKTTLMRMILGLEKPDSGVVALRGRAWDSLSAAEQRAERKRVQVVFQDPLASFDPRYTVERVLDEALAVAGYARGEERRARAIELLELVRLNGSYLSRRPIEMSGGQRQRISIARALAPKPEVIVFDEPVSALDVSVQAQILNLLGELKAKLGLSSLFISHDLGVIRHVSDRLLVMKDGHVVESGDVDEVFSHPRHDYTRSLLGAIPLIDFKSNAVYI